MTIRTKIALVFTAMTATILLLLSVFVYILSMNNSHNIFFTRLKVRASLTAETHFNVDDLNSSIVKEMRQRHLQRLPQEKDYFIYGDARVLPTIPEDLVHLPASFFEEIREEGSSEYHEGFLHYSGITYESPTGRHIVIASAYDEQAENHIIFLRNLLFLGFSASCILMFGLGRVFAYRIMAPVSSIISKVHGITATNLSERLPEGNGRDELSEMARTFNAMLDRLETTFDLQSNFVSNASHELRTPLTSILGEAEVVLQAPRSNDQYVQSIKIMQEEAAKLEEVTSSLLRLSQISYEGNKQKIEPLYMDEMLMSIKINLDKRFPGNQVRVLVQPVEKNPDVYLLYCSGVWMELALTNIIQNSIKYSDNKEVLVTLAANDDDFFIHISDYGIGIPEEELAHVFEPFFRASNTTRYLGYGIGLPLAGRIVRLHSGKIKISSRPNEGTKVTLQFPQLSRLKRN